MTSTYKLISAISVGSGGAANIDFTNIPQTYTDLKIVTSLRSNRNASLDIIGLTFNNTTANRSSIELFGSGTSAGSGNDASNMYMSYCSAATDTGNTFNNGELYIPNYASTTIFKAPICNVVSESATSTAYQTSYANLWSDTAAITRVTIFPVLGSLFTQHSTAYLYGIANPSLVAGDAYASGGQRIYADSTYWYHVFYASGTFTPDRSLTCDYLVIAGGGGGGGNFAGGGGAGGVRCTVGNTGGGGALETPLSLTAQAYTVTVGAGGPGDSGSGTNSVFASITSTAGGLGGGGTAGGDIPGFAGGSGGGGGGVNGSVNTNPNSGGTRTASPVQGNNGGVGRFNRVGGGGGGGGAIGGSASGTVAGAGGAGVTTSISGTSTIYGGGGGGGSLSPTGSANGGGAGGGGNGAATSGATGGAGTINTGSGGGGGPGNGSGGAGGSGIVIVRYAK